MELEYRTEMKYYKMYPSPYLESQQLFFSEVNAGTYRTSREIGTGWVSFFLQLDVSFQERESMILRRFCGFFHLWLRQKLTCLCVRLWSAADALRTRKSEELISTPGTEVKCVLGARSSQFKHGASPSGPNR